MTLRARLALALVFIATVIVLAGVTVLVLVRASLIDEVDHQLRAAASVAGSPGLAKFRAFGPPAAPLPTAEYNELYAGELHPDGRLITYVMPAPTPEGPLPLPAVEHETAARHAVDWGEAPPPFDVGTESGEGGYRVMALRSPTGLVLVGLPLSRVESTFQQFRLGMIGVVSLILASLLVATWWVERLGLRPIRTLTAAAGAIAGGDLDQRVEPPPAGTEAGRLARAFNVMVGERQAWEEQLRRFVADASHELRTPLTTILGVMELHRSGSLAAGEALDDALRRSHLEARRMAALIEDLLLLAHLDQGRPLADEAVDVGSLAQDAALDARLARPDRTIQTDITPAPPVRGDEFRLRQVVTNLVGNALTHAGEDAAVRVVVRPAEAGDPDGFDLPACLLEVHDDGQGMTAEQASHVFERFYRVDAGRVRGRGGSGLGLSIVRSIVVAHGGEVSLTTAPGEGAVFRVVLPVTGRHFQTTSSGLSPAVDAGGRGSDDGPTADGRARAPLADSAQRA